MNQRFEERGAAAAEPTPATALAALTTTAALRTLVHSGVIDVLEVSGPLTTENLAARAHVRSAPLGLLLSALAECGVVRADCEGRWSAVGSSDAWRVMLPNDESHFDHFLEGVSLQDRPGSRDSAQGDYAAVAELLGQISGVVAEPAALTFAAPNRSMLELGAGDAPWTRAFLAAQPSMTSMAVDRSNVIERLRQRIAALPIEGQVTLVAGDMFEVDIAGRFDIVVVSALCRLHNPAANEQLFRRIAQWLAPMGIVLVLDAMRDGVRRPGLAVYELSLARRTSQGRVYQLDDFAQWMRTAGLCEPVLHETALGCHVLLESRERSTNQSTKANNQQDGASDRE